MVSSQLRRLIENEARRLGFSLVGVAAPRVPSHYGVFESWLDAGKHGEMSYLASERSRQRRENPHRILPECRSILVLGVRYPAPGTDDRDFPRDGALLGRVAAYAWGADYHDFLPARLQDLVIFIEAQVGRPVLNRGYTDSGPILERDLAQDAGLGWIGKNTCLISSKNGSYFLLAEILLDIDLAPDRPFTADRCGACTRCLEACPTACILPDRTIDSRRCISYLTIELKGPIPAGLRPLLGEWVFGCDICQQVCPWNLRFAQPQGDSAFTARPGLPRPDLVHALSLTAEEFNRQFKGNPIKRAKRRGYLRNVAVALGNHADPQAVPALARALHSDPEALVRGHAAWALGSIGGEAARQALILAAQRERDAFVCQELQALLS